MGAHAILISVKDKVAQNTTLPLAVVDRFRVNEGYPIRVSTDLKDHLRKYFPKEAEFINEHDDTVIESDAHGQLSADIVEFYDNPGESRGYDFDYSGF